LQNRKITYAEVKGQKKRTEKKIEKSNFIYDRAAHTTGAQAAWMSGFRGSRLSAFSFNTFLIYFFA